MARGKSNRGNATSLTNKSLTTLLRPVTITRPIVLSPITTLHDIGTDLTQISDRRRFIPMRLMASPGVVKRSSSRLVAPQFGPAYQVGFSKPKDVAVCVRRKTRKQVLFALKKTRAGAGAKKRNRNRWSNVKC